MKKILFVRFTKNSENIEKKLKEIKKINNLPTITKVVDFLCDFYFANKKENE